MSIMMEEPMGPVEPKTLHGPVTRRTELPYTAEVAAATAVVYERLKNQIPAIEWPAIAPLVERINRLKREKL